jgi:hypothetical protein
MIAGRSGGRQGSWWHHCDPSDWPWRH